MLFLEHLTPLGIQLKLVSQEGQSASNLLLGTTANNHYMRNALFYTSSGQLELF